jgi:hypothetical protein
MDTNILKGLRVAHLVRVADALAPPAAAKTAAPRRTRRRRSVGQRPPVVLRFLPTV